MTGQSQRVIFAAFSQFRPQSTAWPDRALLKTAHLGSILEYFLIQMLRFYLRNALKIQIQKYSVILCFFEIMRIFAFNKQKKSDFF